MGRHAVRITADTNVLVRALLNDDPAQAKAARALLESAQVVAVPVAVFCEMAWVLGRGYRYSGRQIEIAIRQYLTMAELVTDRAAVEAGLAVMALHGDFADGAMAAQGRVLGGEVFVTFDKGAGRVLGQLGYRVVHPDG